MAVHYDPDLLPALFSLLAQRLYLETQTGSASRIYGLTSYLQAKVRIGYH